MRNITAMRLSSLLLGALAATWTVAHPGHDVQQEAAERRAFLQNSPRDLSHCAGKLKARVHEARSIERRAQRVSQLAKNGILKGKYLCTECSATRPKSHLVCRDRCSNSPFRTRYHHPAKCHPRIAQGLHAQHARDDHLCG